MRIEWTYPVTIKPKQMLQQNPNITITGLKTMMNKMMEYNTRSTKYKDDLEFPTRQGKRRPTLLIVDDCPMNMQLLELYFKTVHYSVLKAFSGEQAIQLFKKRPIDCIFMDVNMPQMSGIEATKQIRTLEANTDQHCLIIAVTANEHAEQACKDAGMDGFFTKPVNLSHLDAFLSKRMKERQISN
jgi:CheY-like chemotaxis protein